jgi:hypothetical protein
MFRVTSCAVLTALLLVPNEPARAQDSSLVDIRRLAPREVRREGFSLSTAGDVRIRATGAEADSWGRFSWIRTMWSGDDRQRRPWSGNAWILDLRTRRVVWELSEAATERGTRGTRDFSGSVRLPAGSYAAYYAAFPDGDYWTDENGKVVGGVSSLWQDALDNFALRIDGSGARLSPADVDRADAAARAGAVVSIRAAGPGRLEHAGFTVSRQVDVEVETTGEVQDGAEFDFAWIIDADTRRKVWKLTWSTAVHAGGAEKNRTARRVIPFAPGRYAVFYGTDDSHDPTGWNAPPPHDPSAWGVTVRARGASDALQPLAYEHVPARATIAALTGIGDGESRQQGFTLIRAMDVRIYALGEGRDGRMFDYGWITGADSRRRVWQMGYDDTEAAGGDGKNRLADAVVRLEKGSYLLHYVSDGSHSFSHWNAPAPPDGAHWGITVLAAGGALERSAVAPYEPTPDRTLVAEAVRVRDSDDVRRRFTLDRETTLRVYALGEATGGDMHDYGWIEDARTGRRVWEMTYRTTEHAGGAAKNRKFDGSIHLPAGEYLLVYRTDGSHAFGEWNADPPDDPEAWGIAVRRQR